MTKKVLLWVEDNLNKVFRELIQKTAQNKGLEFVPISGVSALRNQLEEFADQDNIVIKGIILDLMIYGADSLADFGYPDVLWNDAADVGEYLLKYVFRNNNPEQDDLAKLMLPEKPVLILTVKPDSREEDFYKYGERITLAHKYDLDEKDVKKQIRDWINAI
jgi:hypothetical protein